jgi:hypothetical protein
VLLDLHQADDAALRDAVEAWIRIEVDRKSDQTARDALVAELASVLADVRAAVRDWQPMRAKALEIVDELRSGTPRGVREEELRSAARSLCWLADDRFTFLGFREYDVEAADGDVRLVARPGTGLGVLAGERELGGPGGASPDRASEAARAADHEGGCASDRAPLVVLRLGERRQTGHRGPGHDGPGRIAFRTPVATRTRLSKIIGRPDVQAVEPENLDIGERRTLECDTVILTGDWIADNELARTAGIPLNPTSKSPLVDTALRTEKPGVFAIGNALYPVDTADIAALDGAALAQHVRDYLDGHTLSPDQVQLHAQAPFRWVSPSILRLGDPAPPRNRLLLWTDEYISVPKLVLHQDNPIVARKRILWPAAPGRSSATV